MCSLFTSEVGDYAGQYVKTADKALCDEMKANGRLVSKDSCTHRWVGLGAWCFDVFVAGEGMVAPTTPGSATVTYRLHS